MPVDTYSELKQEMDFDYKWRQKKSVSSSKRPAPLHVTSLTSACTRKAFLKILTENKVTAYGVQYYKNFFGGEALHIQMDKYAPTPKEAGRIMFNRYPNAGVSEAEWRATIMGIYEGLNQPMGELKMAWNVIEDKPVNFWDSEKNDITEEVRAYTPEQWLNIVVGEMDSAIPYLDKQGKPAMAILDNKTTVILPTDPKYPAKVWDEQLEQMSIYAYLLHKNGLKAPKLGGIRTLNYADRFMDTKNAVVALRKPIREKDVDKASTEEVLKTKMSQIKLSYNTGILPEFKHSSLCSWCEVANKCLDAENVKPKPEIELGI